MQRRSAHGSFGQTLVSFNYNTLISSKADIIATWELENYTLYVDCVLEKGSDPDGMSWKIDDKWYFQLFYEFDSINWRDPFWQNKIEKQDIEFVSANSTGNAGSTYRLTQVENLLYGKDNKRRKLVEQRTVYGRIVGDFLNSANKPWQDRYSAEYKKISQQTKFKGVCKNDCIKVVKLIRESVNYTYNSVSAPKKKTLKKTSK